MVSETAVDPDKLQAFTLRAMGHLSGAFVTLGCAVGDRLGLFRDLAAHGPATSEELAERTGLAERYLREWLALLACGEYLTHDPASGRFALMPEAAALLADESGPTMRLGAFASELPSMAKVFDRLLAAFRTSEGVPFDAYDEHLYEGDERLTSLVHDHFLVQKWIPAVPDVQAALEGGARVADLGAGGGRALIRLAQAFPASRCVGYDVVSANVARATAAAEAAGVTDRVSFTIADIAAGLPEQYDLVTMFAVLHDTGDPLAALRVVRAALRPGGVFLCGEAANPPTLEERIGPLGALRYGSSLFYCLPTALTAGGAALGASGLTEPVMRELCAAAGFSGVERVPVQPPVWVLYVARS